MSTSPEETAAAEKPPITSKASTRDSPAPTIKLVVGLGEETFEIPEDLICTRCPFFFNAFSGSFLEAKTKVVTFPDDDPQRFRELQSWLRDDDTPKSSQSWSVLSRIWLFADKYHIDELQNAVMDALYAKFAAHEEGINISFETLDYVAENTFPRSPLRRIFADMLTNGISLQQLPKRVDQIPPEFLQDMCLATKQL